MIPKDELKQMYKKMLRIRFFEEKAIEIFKIGLIEGSVHPYIGEEAIAVGACALLNDDDYIVSTHRGHGHLIAKGVNVDQMMAELMMRADGISKARGGSMHMADPSKGVLGTNGIVGGGLPISVGAALSIQLKKENRVVVCFFSDGASNNGVFHEALNMASLWKVPVVFICENNNWAIASKSSEYVAGGSIGRRAAAYDIPNEIIDGNNVITVYNTVQKAVERARGGEGPTFIECVTYRQTGHSVGDTMWYKNEEDLQIAAQWADKCPIKNFEKYLLDNAVLKDEDLVEIREEILAEMEKAAEFGQNSPLASFETVGNILADVYTDTSGEVN